MVTEHSLDHPQSCTGSDPYQNVPLKNLLVLAQSILQELCQIPSLLVLVLPSLEALTIVWECLRDPDVQMGAINMYTCQVHFCIRAVRKPINTNELWTSM